MENDIIGSKKGHGTKKKTPFQLKSLEKYYSEDNYPKQTLMKEYAASLNLAYSQIRTWFVERRRKERRENELRGCCKSLLGGQPKYGAGKGGKIMNVNNLLGRRKSKSSSNSRYGKVMNHESDQSMDSLLSAESNSFRLNEKPPTSKNYRSSSKYGEIKYDTSARHHGPCNPRSTLSLKKRFPVSRSHLGVRQKNRSIRLQVLFSKDHILKSIFRKDGPALGVEFDSLPSRSFGFQTDSGIHSCQDDGRALKRRKILCSTAEPGNIQVHNVPSKKYGIGKGLMTVWRATNPKNLKRISEIQFVDGAQVRIPCESSVKETLCRASKGGHQLKLVPRQCNWRKKLQENRRPTIRSSKVPCTSEVYQKKTHWTICKLLLDEPILEQSNALEKLVDDEELELKDLDAGPNPLRCSAHFALDGRHGCPLCKDLLAKFPPQTVKMTQPLCSRPWDTTPELVKKLFKVLCFLYSKATTLEICPFTLEDLAFAFTDKDSMLIGKIHVALLELLLLDVQRQVSSGLVLRASKDKDGRFLGFLHFVREQEIDVNVWCQSLNPLTWTEVLRQVLVASGFGSKSNTARREILNKEMNLMAKYDLRPRTLKCELFNILSDQGSGGQKVSELAKASQIVSLDVPSTKEEIEELICLTLSSDVTLFEKIAPSAYRIRIKPDFEGKEDFQSDSDSGCVHDDSGGSSCSSSDDESGGSEELDSARREQRITMHRDHCKRSGQQLTKYTEIDESYSGEACVLGLMEGEYSDLSIDEKLDALIALIDLTGACSDLGMEEPSRVIPEAIPSILYHGSGAKIKKSLIHHQMLQDPEITPIPSRKGQSSKTMCAKNKDKSGHDSHPMQAIYLGSDRRYNKYWLFLGPCDIVDPGHRQIYFESSEDGHWEVINTAQALDALLSALDCRGRREARLFESLDKREAFLCQAMDMFTTAESISRQTPTESNNSGEGSSLISDVDNIVESMESMDSHPGASGAAVLELGKSRKEKKQKWDRLQAYDKWVWNGFYSGLNVVKRRKMMHMESLARCESCHDLYWRDAKHCRVCHATFELDFDLEEKYAIHVATCRAPEGSSDFPKHKVLPSRLQALKAASHAIEAGMPEGALSDMWTKSNHKLWVRRLQRTSSLSEFLQVFVDFVGAIKEGWLNECASTSAANAALDEIIVSFQTMPQTTSAVALWLVKFDALLAPHLDKVQPEPAVERRSQRKRRS